MDREFYDISKARYFSSTSFGASFIPFPAMICGPMYQKMTWIQYRRALCIGSVQHEQWLQGAVDEYTRACVFGSGALEGLLTSAALGEVD